MKFSLEISRDRNVSNKADSASWAPQWLNRMFKKKLTNYEKDELSAWAETFNPLRNLSIDRARRIYDSARLGAYAELQWLYQEIEAAHSTIFTCVERRSSALMETDYTIKAVDADKARGFEENLAEEQRDFLKLAFADAENGNLNEAIEHLGLGFFRGFSHVKPLYNNNFNTLEGFQLLDCWNFCRDIHTGDWYWNPKASMAIGDNALEKIPEGELVSLQRSRHVDYPALNIYIRDALGEKKYGQFIERYGLPPVIITMPPDIDKEKEPFYLAAAQSVARGGNGALPNGSTATYATEARGTNPFESFFKHQQEQIVLMATGGILTSLSSPTGIGQGASEAHSETWRTVIRRDCKLLTTPLNRVVVDTLLEAAFPGQPKLAYFAFADPKPTAAEVFENASKAKTAGYLVKQEDLEEKTGYVLEPDPNAATASMPYQISTPVAPAAQPEKKEDTAVDPAALEPVEEVKAAKVAETGMNGAQVTALLDIIEKVKAGAITLTAAPVVMKAAFPLLEESKITEMLPKPEEIATGQDQVANKAVEIAGKSLQTHCNSHGGKISNKGDPSDVEGLESVSDAISGVSADPINEALKVIEKGGTETQAMAAYDKAAAAVLSPEKIAEGAEEISKVLEDAAKAGKGSEE